MASKPYNILKKYANGVMDSKGRFHIFRAAKITTSGGTLPVKRGVRYYIESITAGFTAVAGDTGVSLTAAGVQQTVSTDFFVMVRTTAVVGDQHDRQDIGILFDEEQAVTITAANITTFVVTMIYAEIVDQGEYST